MTEREKSLELAELMGWKVYWEDNGAESVPVLKMGNRQIAGTLNTYNNLAQFAAILLKYPEVLVRPRFIGCLNNKELAYPDYNKPTQENILDEILRMNSVEIE